MSSTTGEPIELGLVEGVITFSPPNDENDEIEKLKRDISKMEYAHDLEKSKIENEYERKLSEKEREITNICREHRIEMQNMETEYMEKAITPITNSIENILADRAILFKTKRGMILFGVIAAIIIALIVSVVVLVLYIKIKGI